MMKWKKLPKRILSILMAAVILASTAAIAVSAEEQPSAENPVWYYYVADVLGTDKYGRVPNEGHWDWPDYQILFFLTKKDYEAFINPYDKSDFDDTFKNVYWIEPLNGINTHYGDVVYKEYTKEPPATLFWAIIPNSQYNGLLKLGGSSAVWSTDNEDYNFSQTTGYAKAQRLPSEKEGFYPYEQYVADTYGIQEQDPYEQYLANTYGIQEQG